MTVSRSASAPPVLRRCSETPTAVRAPLLFAEGGAAFRRWSLCGSRSRRFGVGARGASGAAHGALLPIPAVVHGGSWLDGLALVVGGSPLLTRARGRAVSGGSVPEFGFVPEL